MITNPSLERIYERLLTIEQIENQRMREHKKEMETPSWIDYERLMEAVENLTNFVDSERLDHPELDSRRKH